MVAKELLLLTHVPPVAGVTLAVEPTHTAEAPPKVGAPGIALIVTFAEAGEVQVLLLVTVKVYVVLTGSPVMVKLVPVPLYVVPPGVLVIVQLPVAGRPLNTTLPVGVVQVGCAIVPTTGAVGLALTVNGKVLLHPSLVLV
jgi:hypothetical protein